MTAQPNPNRPGNARVISRLLFVVVGMFGFGFALVPLYDVFCDITGLNGKTTGERLEATQPMQVDTSRSIEVEFVASLNSGMPWEFRPKQRKVTVHPGAPARISYIARNLTDEAITGHAVPSVAPGRAANYFEKTECFCFTEQTLEAGEEKEMPVIFVVDPELPDDVNQLALSYTFFMEPSAKSKDQPVALNQ